MCVLPFKHNTSLYKFIRRQLKTDTSETNAPSSDTKLFDKWTKIATSAHHSESATATVTTTGTSTTSNSYLTDKFFPELLKVNLIPEK